MVKVFHFKIGFFLLVALICFKNAYAQEIENEILTIADDPKIGLVLSGGGARGLAHIGVLKRLEEMGIQPDIITGTSMGSIIGALYAIGYSADQLDSLSRALDWSLLFSDQINHRYLNIQDKIWDGRFFANFQANEEEGIRLPKGLITGQQVSLTLTQLFWPYLDQNQFNAFPIPFGCVAMDLETGESVFLKEGSITDAIRSSISIPTVFIPNYDERTNQFLVDGGWVKNLPVSEAIEMGANLIIAVDVTSDLYDRDKINNLFDVLEQTSKYRVLEINEQEKSYADLVIQPTAKNFGGQDFDQLDTLINSGYQAALLMQNELEMIKSRMVNSRFNKILLKKITPIYISDIRLSGLEIDDELEYKQFTQSIKGRLIYPEDINQLIQSIYARGDFESVKHVIYPDKNSAVDGYTLHLQFEQKSPSELKIGLRYDNETQASILLQSFSNDVLTNKSNLSATVRLGEEKYYAIQHTQFNKSEWLGFQFRLQYQNRKYDLFEDLSRRVSSFSLNHFNSSFNIGSIVRNRLLVKTGVRYDLYNITNDINTQFDQIRKSFNGLSVEAQIFYDYLDRVWFPRSGQKWDILFNASNSIFGQATPFSLLKTRHKIRISPIDELTLGSDVYLARTTGSTIPAYFYSFIPNDQFDLFMDYQYFFGQPRQRLSGRNLAVVSGLIQYNISRTSRLGLHYTNGLSSNSFSVSELFSKQSASGFAMSYGKQTVVGPIQIFLGSGTNQNITFQIRIGYDF